LVAPEVLGAGHPAPAPLNALKRAELVGCDFSSSPSRRKPIVIARGSQQGGRVQLSGLERLESLDAFSAWLQQPLTWVGGFDLPFGLPVNW